MCIAKTITRFACACVFSLPARSKSGRTTAERPAQQMESEIAELKVKINALESGKAPCSSSSQRKRLRSRLPQSWEINRRASPDGSSPSYTERFSSTCTALPCSIPATHSQDERPALVRRLSGQRNYRPFAVSLLRTGKSFSASVNRASA